MLLHLIKKDFSSFQWTKRLKNHLIFLSTFIYASYSILLIVFQVLFHLSDDETGIINVFIAALIILYSIALTSDIGKKNFRLFFVNSHFNRKYIYKVLVASELGLPMMIFILAFILLFPVFIGQVVLNKSEGLLFSLNIIFLFFTEVFFISSIKILIFSIAQRWNRISFNKLQQFLVLTTAILVTIFFEKIYLWTLNVIKSLFNHNLDEKVIEFFGLNSISLYSFHYFYISLILLIISFCFFLITYPQIIKNYNIVGSKRKKGKIKSSVPILLMTKQYGLFTPNFLYSTIILNVLYILNAEKFNQDARTFILVIGLVSLLPLTGSVLPVFLEFFYTNQLLNGKKMISLLVMYNMSISSVLFLIFMLFSNIRITYTNVLIFFVGIIISVPFVIILKNIFLWISRKQSVSLAKNISYHLPIFIFMPITLILILF